MNYEEVLAEIRTALVYVISIAISAVLITIGFIFDSQFLFIISVAYMCFVVLESITMLIFSANIREMAKAGMNYDKVQKNYRLICEVRKTSGARITILFLIAFFVFPMNLELLSVILVGIGIALGIYNTYNADLYDEFEQINATIEEQYAEEALKEKEND